MTEIQTLMYRVIILSSRHYVCAVNRAYNRYWMLYKCLMFVNSILTFQGVLLSPHDVDQGALQRVHVEAVK